MRWLVRLIATFWPGSVDDPGQVARLRDCNNILVRENQELATHLEARERAYNELAEILYRRLGEQRAYERRLAGLPPAEMAFTVPPIRMWSVDEERQVAEAARQMMARGVRTSHRPSPMPRSFTGTEPEDL